VILVGILPLINYIFRKRPAAKRLRQGFPPPPEKNRGADEVDIWILRAALLSDVIGVTGYVFSRSGGMFVASAIITAFGGLGSATIQAAVSKHVPPERVGQMLGAIGLLHSLARIVAPIIFNQLYASTVEGFPQAFLVLLATVFALALAASFLLKPHGMFCFVCFQSCAAVADWRVVYMKGEEDEAAPHSSSSADRARQEALGDEEVPPAYRP
jgi:MFS family permease